MKEVDIFSVCFSHDIFCDTIEFSVVKQARNASVPGSVVVAHCWFQ